MYIQTDNRQTDNFGLLKSQCEQQEGSYWFPKTVGMCKNLLIMLHVLRMEILTVNFLNIRTPKTFVVITLKVEQDGVSLE